MSVSIGKQLVSQVNHHFHRLPETRYFLSVVKDNADQQYNYFFYIRRQKVSTRSLPLGSEPAVLANLVATLATFRQTYQLPVELVGFSRDERRQLRRFTK